MSTAREPLHVEAEVISSRRTGAYRHLTLAAAGIPQRFRAGNFVTAQVPGRIAPCALWVHRIRESSAYGPTIEVVLDPVGPATRALAALPVGARLGVTGPLGRPFALPKEPARCLLVGEGRGAALLYPLAERLRERGSSVNLAVGAPDEAHLLSTTDARRWVRSVNVFTQDGSVGQRANVAEHVPALIERHETDVVYAAGPTPTLAGVATAAASAGVWCQVALETPMVCGTGLCHLCVLPVLGEDGVARVARTCTEGPVVRGDRVRWEAL